MTQLQYEKLCKIFDKELTAKELNEMGFTQVDGIWDEELAIDMTMLSIDERRKGGTKMTDKEIEKVDIEDTACVAMICIHDNEKYVELEDWEKDVHRLQAIIKQLKTEKEQIGKAKAKEILQEVTHFLNEQSECVNSMDIISDQCKECYEGSQTNRHNFLKELAQKHGVEVDE